MCMGQSCIADCAAPLQSKEKVVKGLFSHGSGAGLLPALGVTPTRRVTQRQVVLGATGAFGPEWC